MASLTEYKQAVAGVIAGVVLAFFGVDTYRGSVNPRPDPFTGTDGLFLEVRVANECKEYTDKKFKEHNKRVMPPFHTRERQIHIEDFLHDKYPEFRRKSNQW